MATQHRLSVPASASECRNLHDFCQYWRNLVNQEQKFREQLSQLQELAAEREAEGGELRQRAGQLEAELADKTTTMLRMQGELESANKQSELLHQKLRQLEEDIAGFKRCNAQLAGELAAKVEADEAQAPAERLAQLQRELEAARERADESCARAERLAGDVARLEAELAAARAERDALDAQRRQLLQERGEEMEIVQKALEEAHEERATAQRRFEQDFERLRTVNTDREQQLLEDFEWKLREVQQTCKKRLEDKDKAAEQRATAVRAELQEKLATAERRVAEAYDTQRALRAANRENERLAAAEKQLRDELARLKGMVEAERSYAASVQRNFDRHVTDSEKKLSTRLVEQRDELTQQWEEKVRAECARLRTELEQVHAENTQLALEAARQERNREHESQLAGLERKLQSATKEVSSLRSRAAEREAEHERDLESAQTAADRSSLELRRRLDKLDLQYQDQMERLREQHAAQLERLQEEADRRVLQAEQAWQMQASSTRATLELVKEQLERDAQARLDALERDHQGKLNEQWERLTREREDALQDAQERHYAQLEHLRRELEGAGKDHNIKESEMMEVVEKEEPLVPTTVLQFGESSGIVESGADGSNQECGQSAEQCGPPAGRLASPQPGTEEQQQTACSDTVGSGAETQGEPAAAAGGDADAPGADGGAAAGKVGQPGAGPQPGEEPVAGPAPADGGADAGQPGKPHAASGGSTRPAKRKGRAANPAVGGDGGKAQGASELPGAGAAEPRGHVQPGAGRSSRRGRRRPAAASVPQRGRTGGGGGGGGQKARGVGHASKPNPSSLRSGQ